MGPYQYKARVARLRLKGGDVREFGERQLQQGAYGDDVMQLQVKGVEGGRQGVQRGCWTLAAGGSGKRGERADARAAAGAALDGATSTRAPLQTPQRMRSCLPLPPPPINPPLPQAYLAEQGYFNAADGLSGYFGAVTGEALQNWQRDQGLRANGVFGDAAKWAVLRQQVRGC